MSQSSSSPALEQATADATDPKHRRTLYEGIPSWRAFFTHYLFLAVATLVVPFTTFWLARLVEAGTQAKLMAATMPLFVGVGALVVLHIYRNSKIVRVTTTNIETEVGVFQKKIDVLELWRCRDIRYRQSLLDRILRIAHIEIFTADVTTPNLSIVGMPASRDLFEQIRDSIEIQRQARNVVGFVQ